jgi:hypothetical protein
MQLPIGKNGVPGSSEEATMTLEELIPVWRKWIKGHSDLVRIRKSVLKNINLPAETKQFLNQGGLVDTVYGGTLTPTLPRLTELVSKIEPLPNSFARYRVLGDIGYKHFQCLDEEGDGRVVVVLAVPDEDKVVFFENSSIRQYAECLLAWGEICEAIEKEDAYFPSLAWDEYIAKYEQAICKIDPQALADESTWYSREINNLKAGIW